MIRDLKPVLDLLNSPSTTLLCVGPLSSNIVDSAIELSKDADVPIVLIASRRQIEIEEFGGGYVNGWTTRDFSEYVRSRDAPKVYLGRDHGGPYQGYHEVSSQMGVEDSMAAALKSFKVDVDAGMDFIHIDPSIPIDGEELDYATVFSRLCDLYAEVSEYLRSQGKEAIFELGTEEQTGALPNLEQFDAFLREIQQFVTSQKLNPPKFVVTQTGTKVVETRNIGVFESHLPSARSQIISQIRKTAAIAASYGYLIKEHNADYLSGKSLALRPHIGIKACNVAPEFGTVETRSLIYLLRTFAGEREYEKFVQICFESGKWKKWLDQDSKSSPSDKAVICGHYCYNDPRVIELKNRLRKRLKSSGIDLDTFLKQSIRIALHRYAIAFGYFE